MNNPKNHDLAELAALYAAGALSGAEAEAFEDLLRAGDADATREFARVKAVSEALLRSAPSAEPELITRSNLINRLGLQKAPPPTFGNEKPSAAPDPFSENRDGFVFMRFSDAQWQDTPVPGVQARNLFVDREKMRVTVLLKLAPGVVYPDHDHPDVEECIVLEGDLELGGKLMKAGDYMRVPKGGQHGTPRTVGGCLLLVTTPLIEAA